MEGTDFQNIPEAKFCKIFTNQMLCVDGVILHGIKVPLKLKTKMRNENFHLVD